jgi:diacylglycerol kinase family enzyme
MPAPRKLGDAPLSLTQLDGNERTRTGSKRAASTVTDEKCRARPSLRVKSFQEKSHTPTERKCAHAGQDERQCSNESPWPRGPKERHDKTRAQTGGN